MARTWLSLAVVALGLAPAGTRADAFDNYINPVLAKVPGHEGVKEITRLDPVMMAQNDRVLPGITSAFLVVRTNEGRYSKLLVQPARQRIDADKIVPTLLIDRYVTYREGQERTVQASGQNVTLFAGFHFSLDIGQVVPPALGGDLRFVIDGDLVYAQPVGKAKFYLVTKPLPEAAPRKTERLTVGETFEPRYFNGTYKLYDDGRRSGTLTLQVADDGSVTGSYYSDKDGRKYEVEGKLGTPKHAIQFTIRFPKSRQTFTGWLFTGNGQALTGSSRLLDRETGFYAVRVEGD
jgi:hypothetical protein